MLGSLVASVASLKSFFKLNRTTIDNKIFKLHYRVTCTLLLVCCFIISTKQLFGEAIACYVGTKDIIPNEVLNTFCWIQSTFTVETKKGDSSVLAPGIRTSNENDKKIYQKYYQWVSLCLFIQAVAFYFPHFLWKVAEGKKINTLKQDLNECYHPSPERDNEKRNAAAKIEHQLSVWELKVESLAEYFMKKRGTHMCYAMSYFGCELLNSASTTFQIWLMDLFFENEFLTYGYKVLKFVQMDQEDRNDPMILVFPRLAKCVFRSYGPSGELQQLDALCVLPLNIANEKMYVVIWFWMVFLAGVSALMVLYRVPILLHAHFRTVFALRFYTHNADLTKLGQIYYKCDVGDWLLLRRLSQNMDGDHFSQLVDIIYERMVERRIIVPTFNEETQRLRKGSTISTKSSGDSIKKMASSISKPLPRINICC